MNDLLVDPVLTTVMCVIYVVIGVLAGSCNILNLTIYNSSTYLRGKYLYSMALDCGEIVNAIGYLLVALGHGFGLMNGWIHQPATVYDCFYKRFWVHFLILGTELPGYCIILISVERILATVKPYLYNRIFKGWKKLFLLVLIPIAGLTSLTLAGVSAIGEESNRTVATQHCSIISSTSIWYSTYHFVAIVLVYVVSFVSLTVVKIKTRKFAKLRDSRIDVMMAISGSSIILIGSSAFVMITIRWGILEFSDLVVAITYSMTGIVSMVNTVCNLALREELRHQLLYLLGYREQSIDDIRVRAPAIHGVKNTPDNVPLTPKRVKAAVI